MGFSLSSSALPGQRKKRPIKITPDKLDHIWKQINDTPDAFLAFLKRLNGMGEVLKFMSPNQAELFGWRMSKSYDFDPKIADQDHFTDENKDQVKDFSFGANDPLDPEHFLDTPLELGGITILPKGLDQYLPLFEGLNYKEVLKPKEGSEPVAINHDNQSTAYWKKPGKEDYDALTGYNNLPAYGQFSYDQSMEVRIALFMLQRRSYNTYISAMEQIVGSAALPAQEKSGSQAIIKKFDKEVANADLSDYNKGQYTAFFDIQPFISESFRVFFTPTAEAKTIIGTKTTMGTIDSTPLALYSDRYRWAMDYTVNKQVGSKFENKINQLTNERDNAEKKQKAAIQAKIDKTQEGWDQWKSYVNAVYDPTQAYVGLTSQGWDQPDTDWGKHIQEKNRSLENSYIGIRIGARVISRGSRRKTKLANEQIDDKEQQELRDKKQAAKESAQARSRRARDIGMMRKKSSEFKARMNTLISESNAKQKAQNRAMQNKSRAQKKKAA